MLSIELLEHLRDLQRTLTILTQSVTKLNGALEAELKHFFLSLHIHITILCRENVTLLKIMPGLNDFILGQNGENGTKW